MKRYRAPWNLSLIVVTALVTIVCLSITAFHWADLAALRLDSQRFWAAFVPLAIVAGAALFTIRGYSITPRTILVHRLLWATRLQEPASNQQAWSLKHCEAQFAFSQRRLILRNRLVSQP
jgi:uncharacterized membrane protein YdbT with pleckstrin-like domain